MLSGSISLKHPGLNLRPEFTSAVKNKEDARVALFEVHDRTELGQTLDKLAQINSSAARALKDAKVAESLDESQWNLWEQSRKTAGSQFNDLKSLSEASLRTASHLAFAAASFLGPAVVGGVEHLSDDIQKLGLYQQTSQESLIHSSSEFAHLSGDSYSTRVQEKVVDGEVVNENPLFNTESAPIGSLIVDLKNGVAVIEDYR
mgnify:CR=1 FL=1